MMVGLGAPAPAAGTVLHEAAGQPGRDGAGPAARHRLLLLPGAAAQPHREVGVRVERPVRHPRLAATVL